MIVRIGINGRLDTLQAAILNVKLDVFPDEIVSRQRVAERYTERLAGPCITPVVPAGYQSVWAQYTLRVGAARRDPLIKRLAARGIPTMVYYPRSLHEQTAYRHYPIGNSGIPRAMALPLEVVSLPMHPYLEPAVQHRIIAAVREELVG
jgi:dTDP-4-amino-4,6-dideoxygalactose transaminase